MKLPIFFLMMFKDKMEIPLSGSNGKVKKQELNKNDGNIKTILLRIKKREIKK